MNESSEAIKTIAAIKLIENEQKRIIDDSKPQNNDYSSNTPLKTDALDDFGERSERDKLQQNRQSVIKDDDAIDGQ